jgi:hypothetical protein
VVRQQFLITRNLRDYLRIFRALAAIGPLARETVTAATTARNRPRPQGRPGEHEARRRLFD